jgi:hypothetical protein
MKIINVFLFIGPDGSFSSIKNYQELQSRQAAAAAE